MSESKQIRISTASAKDFDRGSFRTYTLDESHGVTVVVAKDSKDGVVKAQSFQFDLAKNPAWNFQNADSYVKASLEEVNALVAAVRGSATFKTLAEAANAGVQVPVDKIKSGLRLASIDAKRFDELLEANKGKAAVIDHDKVAQRMSLY
jgi:hypothetical protein